MKFLLTSGGITNASIQAALVDLLGKPISECSALIIPTGMHPFPGGGTGAWQAVSGASPHPFVGLGWKEMALLELTALPTVRRENWVPAVQQADALLVWGGDVLYLCHWMRESGLAQLLPMLERTVYVGMSAGSIAVTPVNCDAEFDLAFVPDDSDIGQDAGTALALVDVTLDPHLDNPEMPDTTAANIEAWASGVPVPVYTIDDDTALRIVDGRVEVVSEGTWHLFGG